MTKYYIAIYGGAVLTIIAQLFLKKGAILKSKNFINSFFNKYIFMGYFLFCTVTLLNLFGLKEVKLIDMVIINPIIQILVVSLSFIIFKEKLNKKQIFGIGVIILGIIIFNLNF